ncbi:MAG: hypothetical protein ACYC2H_12655 [Thermoplasmatota archaeon]
MDERANRTWRWFRFAAVPLAAVVLYVVYDVGFRLTDGAGASGEGWLVALGTVAALAMVLAAAVALRLPLREVGLRAGVGVLATVVTGIVLWAIIVSVTTPACAASTLAPASC